MKADGLILLGYGDYLAYESKLARLVEQGTHFVRWGPVLPGSRRVDRLRQRRGRRARRPPPAGARAQEDRLPRRRLDPLPEFFALLRLRYRAARGRLR